LNNVLLFAAVVALCACAAKPPSEQPNEIAHGSEKVAAEAAHPGEPLGGPHHGPKFLGLPAWIWKLANMIAFLAFLGWLIGGPVKGALASRHQHIQQEAQEARGRRVKADQMAADIEARLRQLEDEVRTLGERAVAEGERQKQELIAAAEAEAQKILQNARTEVDNRVRSARKELTEYAGQLASERAEQILRDKITDADQKKLFAESVRDVEGA
jgi:F-type H+-transporting ATPase subunit b